MARGMAAPVGSTRVAQNGYHYTKVEVDGKGLWRLTHHIVAESVLGRPLRDNERVIFKGSRRNLHPENIVVVEKGSPTLERRLAEVENRIEELKAERDDLLKQIRIKGNGNGPTNTH